MMIVVVSIGHCPGFRSGLREHIASAVSEGSVLRDAAPRQVDIDELISAVVGVVGRRSGGGAARSWIGQRLARIRKDRGFTQVELAEEIGIIQSLVSSYESGALRLSANMAVRFAAALEVSVDELLRSRPAKGAGRQPEPQGAKKAGAHRGPAQASAKRRAQEHRFDAEGDCQLERAGSVSSFRAAPDSLAQIPDFGV